MSIVIPVLCIVMVAWAIRSPALVELINILKSGSHYKPVYAGLNDPIPVYPGSTIQTSIDDTTNDSPIHRAVWQTAAPVQTVVFWYVKAMKDQQWTLHLSPTRWDNAALQYLVFKKNAIALQLSVSKLSPASNTMITVELVPAAGRLEHGE